MEKSVDIEKSLLQLASELDPDLAADAELLSRRMATALRIRAQYELAAAGSAGNQEMLASLKGDCNVADSLVLETWATLEQKLAENTKALVLKVVEALFASAALKL